MSQGVVAAPADGMPAKAEGIPPRAVIAVIIGNWLEFYDFIVFTFFAVMIGKAFFPPDLVSGDYSATEKQFFQLLAALATFWAGFFTRPIGAAIIGSYGDRAGRKAAMTLTILLMALGTALLAFAPTYAQVGVWSPIILIVARLIQGFSCGGEVGPATTYLLEAAPPNQRAALTAWQGTSQQFAGVMGTGIGLTLAATLSEADLYSWGWRVPFMIGIVIAPVGLYIRSMLPETIEQHEAHGSQMEVLRNLFAHHTPAILLGILCIVGPTISTYVSSFMATYAITTLKQTPQVGMFVTMCGYIVGIAAVPLGAWIADRIGPKISIIVPRLIFVLIVYQAFVLINAPGSNVDTLIVVNIVMNFVTGLANGGLYVVVTQAFPKAVRSAGLAIAYSVSVTMFGGSTQVIIAWLIERLHDPLVPAWYQIGANIVSILAVLLIAGARPAKPVIEREGPG